MPPPDPGRHTSSRWRPHLSFTLPDGWGWADSDKYLLLQSLADPAENIELVHDVYPARVDGQTCAAQDDIDAPRTASDFLAYINGRPDWTGTATPVVLGGLNGWRVEGEIDGAGCRFRYTSELSGNSVGSVSGTGPWKFYLLDDGRGLAILVEARGDPDFIATAESVIDTFAFDTGLSGACPTPPLSQPPAPPTVEAGLRLEAAYWQDADGGYRYVVLVTNTQAASTVNVVATTFDACGNQVTHRRLLYKMARDETAVLGGDLDPGFVPVRMEVHGSSNVTVSPKSYVGTCTRLPDGVDPDGIPIVKGSYRTSFLVDVFLNVAAVYRDGEGRVVGADALEVVHRWAEGRQNDFAIERSIRSPAVASTEFYCYERAVAP
jgi:hypothetical protein